jgi:uncharacterized protein YjbI with pentapeptide repeats
LHIYGATQLKNTQVLCYSLPTQQIGKKWCSLAQYRTANFSNLSLAQHHTANFSNLSLAQHRTANFSNLSLAQHRTANFSNLSLAQHPTANFSNLSLAQHRTANFNNLSLAQHHTANFNNLSLAQHHTANFSNPYTIYLIAIILQNHSTVSSTPPLHSFYQFLLMRSAFFWDFTKCRMAIPYRHCGTTCWSHLTESNSTIRGFKEKNQEDCIS